MRFLPLALLAAGCTGNTVEFPGTDITGYFEFQNNLGYQWEFVNDETTLDYRMVGEIEDYLIVDEKTRYTMVYRKACLNPAAGTCTDDGSVLRTLTFTSDFAGVLVYEADGVELDPPVAISPQFMKVGEMISTGEYTSTFNAVAADCPVAIPNWTQCPNFTVEGPESSALVGDYHVAQNFGIVTADWPDQPGRWKLSNHVALD